MSTWKTLGQYLDRPVAAVEWAEDGLLESKQVESSVILLVFGAALPPRNKDCFAGAISNGRRIRKLMRGSVGSFPTWRRVRELTFGLDSGGWRRSGGD